MLVSRLLKREIQKQLSRTTASRLRLKEHNERQNRNKRQKRLRNNYVELKAFITINPFPRSGCDAGLFLRANPHELGLQVGLATIELGEDVVLGCATEIVQQIAT